MSWLFRLTSADATYSEDSIARKYGWEDVWQGKYPQQKEVRSAVELQSMDFMLVADSQAVLLHRPWLKTIDSSTTWKLRKMVTAGFSRDKDPGQNLDLRKNSMLHLSVLFFSRVL